MGDKKENLKVEVDVGKYDVDEHICSIEDVVAKFSTSVNVVDVHKSFGLSKPEAAKRLSANGPNALTPPKKTPEWIKYLKQYTNPLLMLIVVASALSFAAYIIQDPKDLANLYIGGTLALCTFLLANEAVRL